MEWAPRVLAAGEQVTGLTNAEGQVFGIAKIFANATNKTPHSELNRWLPHAAFELRCWRTTVDERAA
jgi:hypothetical protein